jgi:type IV secretory pathway protease TraF
LALVNESPSVPKGLYLRVGRTATTLGEIVAVRPPSQARAYLAALGTPAEVRLLKRVAAAAGARVCAAPGALDWPGGAVAVLARDRRGVPLPAWSGCRTLAPDELLLLGDTRTSFDSRYFGPVSRAAVDGVYREVLTW